MLGSATWPFGQEFERLGGSHAQLRGYPRAHREQQRPVSVYPGRTRTPENGLGMSIQNGCDDSPIAGIQAIGVERMQQVCDDGYDGQNDGDMTQ